MALQSISAAIKSIPSKKEDLRKAFEELQSHSSALASFTLKWKDLEEHFDSIEGSIDKRFKDLLAVDQQQPPSAAVTAAFDYQPSDSVTWPELKTLCSNMDGKGLRSFILAHRKDGSDIRTELESALRSASDPAKMVLDAMDGFYSGRSKGDKDNELAALRRTCLLLLERLEAVSPVIKESVKERAKKLALEWKGKIGNGGDNQLEGLTFLQLLGTFGLVSVFKSDELLDIFVIIARRKQAPDLCRALGLVEKVPDLIQKLISKGKQLDAVNFAYAFEIVDKFPPVPLLKAYLKEAKKVAQEVRRKGNNSTQSLNEATAKEIAALRAVIKSVEDHKLQSEYSCEDLEKRIAQLEKQKADRKRAAAAKPQQQQPAHKRPRQSAISTDGGPPMLQQLQQPSGLLADRVNPYSASAGLYSLPGASAGAVAGSASLYSLAGGSGTAPVSTSPYALAGVPGSSAPYGMAGGSGTMTDTLYERHLASRFSGSHLAYGGNRSPPMSQLSAEALSSLYDNKPTGYGYSIPPKYDTSYFPGY
ncbi:hypothetical protein AAC387_Pa03g3145 [Persea americana]